jgi:hypothetical protein
MAHCSSLSEHSLSAARSRSISAAKQIGHIPSVTAASDSQCACLHGIWNSTQMNSGARRPALIDDLSGRVEQPNFSLSQVALDLIEDGAD